MLVKELIKKYSLPTLGKDKALLVQPQFPLYKKTKLNLNTLPIALLKLGGVLKEYGFDVELIFFDNDWKCSSQTTLYGDNPTTSCESNVGIIFVTSVFTYWSKYVKRVVEYYRVLYPNVPIVVGGVYASLMPTHCKEYTGCDEVVVGCMSDAENCVPAYDLVDVDFQIIHTSRGCNRRCGSCGTYLIEPCFMFKDSVKEEIIKKKIVFYDNNILMNPFIENILNELVELKKDKKITWCKCQSGLDGRILLEKPYLVKLMKEAGFREVHIAWDGSYDEHPLIEKQINVIKEAGFRAKDISVFMLYNHELPYEELERKRVKCWEWGVMVNHCRYRPLDLTDEHYIALRSSHQTSDDYYIHPNWTDAKIKKYSNNIRIHNSCIRWDTIAYSYTFERKKCSKDVRDKIRKEPPSVWMDYLDDVVDPSKFIEFEEFKGYNFSEKGFVG